LSFPLFSFLSRKPKLLQLWGGPSVDYYKKYWLSKHIFKNVVDLYISVTQLMTQQLIEVGIPKYRIKYLPAGPIDVNKFCPMGKKIDNLILFVGRIYSVKGLHVLLESLCYLKKPVHLVIIGPFWDEKYSKKILKLMRLENEKGLHKVTYIGPQNQENVIKWYQRASVFILPSLQEPGGTVNLEAMSCETPVVASNVGGVPELVRDGVTGLLIPPNNAIKLAISIQYLLDNKDIRIKFGQEGRRWVIKNFSTKVASKKLLEIYEEMIYD